MKRFLANKIYSLCLKKKHTLFYKEMEQAKEVQEQKLKNILKVNVQTLFGEEHSFKKIKNYQDFREAVSVSTYEDLMPYIESLKEKKGTFLTKEPPLMFEKTSGSTQSSKYIPYTQSLLQEISMATAPWIYDLYQNYPKLLHTSQYWSISPKLGQKEITKGGYRVGFEDDSDYFSSIEKIFLKNIFCVSPQFSKLSIKEFRFKTVEKLLADESLGLFSVWSPSFLTTLLLYLETHREELLNSLVSKRVLPKKRLQLLQKILKEETLDYKALWPNLTLISCWTQGSSKLFLDPIKQRLPHANLQGKGLLSTEGVISLPLSHLDAPLLAYHSHFYEFREENGPSKKITLFDELRLNGIYTPIITTSGGLYRYDMADQIKVVGFYKQIPLLEFLGRGEKVSDLCGEKLNELFITDLFQKIFALFHLAPSFAMMVPCLENHPHYKCYIECGSSLSKDKLKELEQKLEEGLSENHHYQLAQKLGQLGPLKLITVTSGAKKYEEALIQKKKMTVGNIKQTTLDIHPIWDDIFP